MKASVEKKMALGFAVSALALAGLGWLSYRTMADSFAAREAVAHTREVMANLEAILTTLTEAEAEQRGYLLTGSASFLAARQEATRQLPVQLQELRQLTADNPTQQQALNRLEALIRRRLEMLDARIATYQQAGLQAAVEKSDMEHGKVVMNDVRSAVNQMLSTEEKLLTQREKRSAAAARQSLVIVSVGGALAVVVSLAAVGLAHRDLKARAQTERALRENRALLEAILDHVPAVVYLKDLAGRYLFVNRQFEQLAGRSREEIAGRTAYDFSPRELARIATEHHQTILATQKPLEVEETVLYPDGPRTHLAIKFPLRDAAGNIYATGGVSRDITERKRAEQLREERDRFFELSRDLICVAGFDGWFKALNPAWERTLGFSREELLRRPFLEFIHPDDADASQAEVDKLAGGHETVNFENRFRCRDGSWRWFLWNARADVSRKLIYATGRDITERKRAQEKILQLNADLQRQAERLEAANKELEAFSYSVSHDLRAPLRHIDGFVGLLARQSVARLDERGQRYLNIIADSARRMGALIDDLLVFSRMGRAELRRTRVAPEALVHEAVEALQNEITGRRIVWNIGTLPEVEADPAMLRQVWLNLLSNAVKYTRPRNPAQIEIGCQPADGEFVFYIRDNGVGFDMQYVHKLFGVFQRLHRSEDFEGTGIGLANVQRIVHRHGGRVWATGRPDAGATFYFSLPASPSSPTSSS